MFISQCPLCWSLLHPYVGILRGKWLVLGRDALSRVPDGITEESIYCTGWRIPVFWLILSPPVIVLVQPKCPLP